MMNIFYCCKGSANVIITDLALSLVFTDLGRMEAWVGMLLESYENNTHREARIQNRISDLPDHHRESSH